MCKLIKNFLYSFYICFFCYYIVILNNDDNREQVVINYLPVQNEIFIKKILRPKGPKKKITNIQPINYTRYNRLKPDLKYILRWSKAFSHYSTSTFKGGQIPFITKNCSYINCFITDNKGLLGDCRHFDAILFDVENFWDVHPGIRSPHQKFIFVASESAENYPICGSYYDGYYNWTWTYKLNSDIRWSYVTVMDKNNNVVGPKVNMTWLEHMDPIKDNLKKILTKKEIAVAWFVSHCNAKSGRENLTKNLEEALKAYHLTIDIYGWCGTLSCPRDRIEDCLALLQDKYYFYLSFENSLSEDYITEKIMYPLNFYTVPIVFGGADYSRFLPPGSYLNAGILNATTLARKIYEAVTNKTVYHDYFRWHNHYQYKERPPVSDICTLCSMLNDPQQLKYSSYNNFREWWRPDYKTVC